MTIATIEITINVTEGVEPINLSQLTKELAHLAHETDIPMGVLPNTAQYELSTLDEVLSAGVAVKGIFTKSLFPAQRLPSSKKYTKLANLSYLGVSAEVSDGTFTENLIATSLGDCFAQFVTLHPESFNSSTITVNGYAIVNNGIDVTLVNTTGE